MAQKSSVSSAKIYANNYRYDFVCPPPDDVICPLCLDIIEEPKQLTCCGHHVCRKCGEKLKKPNRGSNNQCPMCRKKNYTLSPDKYFERTVLNVLMIWCTVGCGQEVELGKLKNHLIKCSYVEEKCSYGCGQRYRRKSMEEHLGECPKRPFVCVYCKYQSNYEVIVNEHYPVCDKYPISCPNECSKEMERGMLQDHLDKCPLQLVECEFTHVGCLQKLHRCDLARHLSENGDHHNALSTKQIYESIQKMMEEKDKLLQEKDKLLQEKDKVIQEKDRQLQEKDDIIIQLVQGRQLLEIDDTMSQGRHLEESKADIKKIENFVSDIYNEVCGIFVTLGNYEQQFKNEVTWFSPPFFTHPFGYMMCFEVDFRSPNTLRIDLYIMAGLYDGGLKWPYVGKVIVRLLNQVGDFNHYDYVFDYKDSNKGYRVIQGNRRGPHLQSKSTELSYELLYDNIDMETQFLVDNCLKFHVIITK